MKEYFCGFDYLHVFVVFYIIVLDKSFILLLRVSRCDGEIKAT